MAANANARSGADACCAPSERPIAARFSSPVLPSSTMMPPSTKSPRDAVHERELQRPFVRAFHLDAIRGDRVGRDAEDFVKHEEIETRRPHTRTRPSRRASRAAARRRSLRRRRSIGVRKTIAPVTTNATHAATAAPAGSTTNAMPRPTVLPGMPSPEPHHARAVRGDAREDDAAERERPQGP